MVQFRSSYITPKLMVPFEATLPKTVSPLEVVFKVAEASIIRLPEHCADVAPMLNRGKSTK